MAQSRDESPPSRIELVVLACLSQSKPPSDAELGDVVQQLALPSESAEVARQRAVELVAGLVRRAWVTGDDGARRVAQPKSSPRKLTESGKRVLRNAFHLPQTPTWAQVRDKHLPALAIGIPPGSELARKACTETGLTAAVLCERFGVHDAFTPSAVCDALVANALGMAPGKLTMDRIRAHVLLRGIGKHVQNVPSVDGKGGVNKAAVWIARDLVGASGTKDKMSRMLGLKWVCGDPELAGVGSKHRATGELAPAAIGAPPPPPPAGPPVAPLRDLSTKPAPPDRRLPLPAPNLLEVVREAIPRIGAEGRFGEKVYVSAIWRTIERDRKAGELSFDTFKHWLVTANRDGWLVLARADLIGAMDAKQVTESEIHDRGATFHFVLDQRNGAPLSQRESHAG
jgi:hypothetical protein